MEISRRSVLRAGAMAAGLVGLGACARTPATGNRATPAPAQTGTVLVADLSWQGSVNYVPTVRALTEDFINANWTSKYKGVQVKTLGWRGDSGFVNGAAAIAEVLAGKGPDILFTCCADIATFISSGILRPIDDLLQRDNINPVDLFPASVVQDMMASGKTYGLPDYGGTTPLYVNLTMLNAKGVQAPPATWDWTLASQIWTNIAGQDHGHWTYGAVLPTEASGSSQWLVRGWGGHVRNSALTVCLLNSKPAADAYSWISPLMANKILFPGVWPLGAPPELLMSGQAAFTPACCGTLEQAATMLRNQIAWDVVPMPTMPNGPADFISVGIYGINAHSQQPLELVWDLYKFITTTPAWQLFFNAKLALQPPILSSPEVWDGWKTVVAQVAPPLQGKNLDAFRQGLDGAYGWPFFRAANTQVTNLWTQAEQQMFSGRQQPQGVLPELTTRINALQQAALQTA